MRMTLAALALAIGTAPALGPVEPTHGPDMQWLCDLAREWKADMRRDYPRADRSMPTVERRCRLPRE